MLEVVLSSLSLHPLLYITLALGLVWWSTRRDGHHENLPPMPEKKGWFLGHALHLKKDFRGKIAEWTEKTGNVFSIYIGHQLVVVISGYDLLKEAFVKQGDSFSGRPKNYGCENIIGYKGIVSSSGENWKEQRTVSLSILRTFGMGKNSLADRIDDEVDAYIDELLKLKGAPSYPRALVSASVSNVISSIIGKRFDLHDADLQEMNSNLEYTFKLAAKLFILNVYPQLGYLPGDLFSVKVFAQIVAKLEAFFYKNFINPARATLSDSDSEPDSFVAAYLQEMGRRQASGKPTTMDDENLIRIITNLFVAGSETTATTILWFIALMIHHPDKLMKIHKEMADQNIERKPVIQDKSKLKFLNACILETQRFGSIVPFGIQHLCTATSTLGGHTIPAGAVVMANMDSVLHNPATWGDPLVFRPERFLDAQGDVKVPEEMMAFGLGRRVCLGESLARMELFLYCAGLCHKFNILPEDPACLPVLKGPFGLTVAPAAYKATFVAREL